ncbi:uncharacterized protein CDAR_272001 [Caerostris darwini]|uniref:FBD domain-containing protein n=1 Tax=Caerostris darwini TaxID=1538125 RepID=A0AAV4W9F6_9ARAC|nr:uncharacterized protein CDAR_272001 [Caerostris darwini]
MLRTTLHEICLDRILELIQERYWDDKKENPFSCLPTRVVEHLVEVCGASKRFWKFSYFRLLLSSGKLQELRLCFPVFFTDTCKLLPQMLTEEGCRNIKILELDKNFQNDESAWLERLIEKLPFLESLVIRTFFNPTALKNCKRLKRVEVIYRMILKGTHYFRIEAVDTLSCLEDLEEFDVFRFNKSTSYLQHVVKLLENHPKLISLGCTDSSRAAHHIHMDSRGSKPLQYGLRKCSWEYNRFSFRERTSMHLERIRSAVLLFPLVEELEILVLHEDCFEDLKNLNWMWHCQILNSFPF